MVTLVLILMIIIFAVLCLDAAVVQVLYILTAMADCSFAFHLLNCIVHQQVSIVVDDVQSSI